MTASTTFDPQVDIDYSEYSWIWEVEGFPTRNQIRLFSSLPLDIARLIFEKTMEFKPLPLHILRVSHQIQHWLEPLIYRYIAIYTQPQLALFYQTFRERRKSSTKNEAFFQNIHTFFVCIGFIRPEKVVAIVRSLTGLRSLACWDESWGNNTWNAVLDSVTSVDGKDDFPYKHLRRISFAASFLVERRISFAHRAFRDISHMDIYFHPFADWESLQHLQGLTHLSLDMATNYPALDAEELPFWFHRILDACPPTVKVVIFGVVDDENADFDLLDSEGRYLPPGWPPCDTSGPALETEGWTPWLTCESKRHANIDYDILHPISRLALGMCDPRAVPAAVTDKVPPNQLFQDLLVYFIWPTNRDDWDGTADQHRDCWTVAGDVIERRRGLTYARLINQLSLH